VAVLFPATLFLTAWLLFSVQPMMAKLLLPALGGAPAVWNTCMVFFQAALLAGYCAAHLIATRLEARLAAAVGWLIFAVPLGLSGMAVAQDGAPLWIASQGQRSVVRDVDPTTWAFAALATSVGLPVLALATSAPTLQKWYATSGQSGSEDPFFLYAASNLGSLTALVGYPLVLEVAFGLRQQVWIWSIGYAVAVVLVLCCALAAQRGRGTAGGQASQSPAAGEGDRPAGGRPDRAIPWRERLRWLVLAAVPSSLMLGVTSHLCTDVASIPLLWVIPLALYLLTFILAFARKVRLPMWSMDRLLPALALMWTLALVVEATEPVLLLFGLHLLTFFVAAMLCHGQLAAERPSPRHLTEYYLWLAAGGVLGGAFNALIAPHLFTRIVEYPLAVLAACWLRPAPEASAPAGAPAAHAPRSADRLRRLLIDVGWAGLVGLLAAVLITSWQSAGRGTNRALGGVEDHVVAGVLLAVPLVVAYLFASRPRRYALALGAVLVASGMRPGVYGRSLHVERTFFGVHRVTRDEAGRFHQLVHGTTVHGRQRWDPHPVFEPSSYYTTSGPVGDVFQAYQAGRAAPRVAVVGLGAGTLAWYAAGRAEEWTFFEIDPTVERIARDPRYFTYLRDAFPDTSRLKIVLGDARLNLGRAPHRHYGLIVLDAFNSDAVPLHLLTREALQLYLDRLAPRGLIALHTSSGHLDFKPVLARLAASVQPPLVCYARADADEDITRAERALGKEQSEWVVLARAPADLGRLVAAETEWRRLHGSPAAPLWTDDFSNLFSVLGAWK
jgi:hypothetical protein